VIPGDLLAQTAHLVIGMSDTFDTAPGVIASTSLQAKFLAAVYDGDIDRLDRDLDDALRSVDAPPVGSIDKTGKTRRYPLGTVAPVLAGERRFFCVAYSAMNSRNEARATIDGLLASLSALWKSVCQHANGGVVAMPVIGMGQSRLSQALSPSDAIRLQIMSFWLASREERLCDGLTVVVRPEVYDALDRRELQAFLAGLRPS
jgi:hypothetical protein